MPDDADIAQIRDEAVNELVNAAHRKPVGPVANGRCHYCDEIVNDTARFCDALCRDAWQNEMTRKIKR